MLDSRRSAELARQPLTYDGVGGSTGAPPAGYRHFSTSRRLASRDLDRLTEEVMTWQVQARSGLRVATSTQRIEVDTVVVLRLGVGPAALTIPCRVVTVIDEPDRRGFAYGTLPGHPESGEEAFVLSRGPDGGVAFGISAFSRPASRLARLGGPLATQAQRLMTARYLRTLD
jgi:uncharacterized protein (UPF0548 family)